MEKYDPMQDLYQKGIAFLFKQGAVITIAFGFSCVTIAAVWLMWGKMERMETLFSNRIEQNNRDWKIALDISRQETRDCDAKRYELAIKVAELEAEMRAFKKKR